MVVVIATPNELELVKKLGYENEPIIITGVGGVNVIRALKHLPKDTEIINIGYAGSNKLPVGEIVDIGWVSTNHEKAKFKELYGLPKEDFESPRKSVGCYTSTDFVTETKRNTPCVFDMELAFICAMFDNVRAIKVVSDNLNLKEYEKNVEKKDAD